MDFVGKKVAILGLGIEGQDLLAFCLKKKARVTVFDQKTAQELGETYRQWQKKANWSLGKNYLQKGLTDFDLVFRSPAFKPSLPALKAARRAGVVVSSATKLFFDLCPGKIIGVTGTKGKGTTASLVAAILKTAGKKVFLAGNIGKPMLALLPKLKKDDWVVLELSSFQLQDMEKSPHLAVVLFIVAEHLNYHQNFQEYLEAKEQIVKHQTKKDFCVVNADNANSKSLVKKTAAQVYFFSRWQKVNGAYVQKGQIRLFEKIIGPVDSLPLRGQHNWDNVCAAVIAGFLAGASLKAIKKAVFAFKGLEHRLEKVAKINGVEYFNDSFATTPETTIAAIKAFAKPVILIAGGSSKGSDFDELGQEIALRAVKSLILVGQEAGKIKKAARKAGFSGQIIFQPKNMKEIVTKAAATARSGEVVLLSPACASFGMFVNYKERGFLFKKNVHALKKKSCS